MSSRRKAAMLMLLVCAASGCHVCSPQYNLKQGWRWSPFWKGPPCERVTPLHCRCGDDFESVGFHVETVADEPATR